MANRPRPHRNENFQNVVKVVPKSRKMGLVTNIKKCAKYLLARKEPVEIVVLVYMINDSKISVLTVATV